MILKRTVKRALAGLACLVLAGSAAIWRVETPLVLHLGIFAGSAWEVPSPQSYAIIDAAIARFEQENPGIQVVYESGITRTDYSQWLAQNIIQGTAPDLFLVLPEDFETLSQIGALKNLDPYIRKEAGLSPDLFYEGALKAGQRDGIQYALPYECNPQLLFANTSLLEENGMTVPEDGYSLESFGQICRQMNLDLNEDGIQDTAGILDYGWKSAADAYHCRLVDQSQQQIDLQNPDFRQAVLYARSLNETDMPRETNIRFDQGNTAFAIMTFAQYRTYAPYPWKVKRFSSFDWQAMEMPYLDEESQIEMNVLNFAMNSRTLLPDASFRLLQILCAQPEIQTLIYDNAQGVSALKAAQFSTQDDFIDKELLDKVMQRPRSENTFEMYPAASDMMDRVLDGQDIEDIDLALINLEKDINLYIAR